MKKILPYLILPLYFLLPATVKAQSYTINTFAGGGECDGYQATNACFVPFGIAVDSAGNIYIGDSRGRLRKVSTSGIITSVAGNGIYGHSGDGGPATAAGVNQPLDIVIDPKGNILFTDYANSACYVRKIDNNGIITSIAGGGAAVNDGGPATASRLYSTFGLTLDKTGNIYVTDQGYNRIRKIDTSGIITTIAGNGTYGNTGDGGPATAAEIGDVHGVALDTAGNIFFTEDYSNRIRKVNTSGIISTICGNGTAAYNGDHRLASTALLNQPDGIWSDNFGNIFFADLNNNRIRFISPLDTIYTIAGSGVNGFFGDGGPAINADLNQPTDLTFDRSGNMYISDLTNHRIRKVNTNLFISTIAGNGSIFYCGDGIPATDASLFEPENVTYCSGGYIYIGDQGNQIVRKISSSGIITTIAGNGIAGYSGEGGPATAAELDYPGYSVNTTAGKVYIDDGNNCVIRQLDSIGNISRFSGGACTTTGLGGPATAAYIDYPRDLHIDNKNNLYFFDGNDQLLYIDTNQIFNYLAGGGTNDADGIPATAARFSSPDELDKDAAGNFYLACSGSSTIRTINTNGIVNTIAGKFNYTGFSGDGGPATNAEFNNPNGIAVDPLGNVFIADYNNYRIRMVNNAGTVNTMAGNGQIGFSGDGGPATAAEINQVNSICSDPNGNIYLADYWNYRIRILTPPPLETKAISAIQNSVFVYPNPANNIVYLQLKGITGKTYINIYNMLGQAVMSIYKDAQPLTELSVASLQTGVYILKLQTEDSATLVKKIEISR